MRTISITGVLEASLSSNPSFTAFTIDGRLGRGSSIQRHFSCYVMCAFLFGEIARRHGEERALGPVAAGREGERFFDQLEELLGITRETFHATIVRLIVA